MTKALKELGIDIDEKTRVFYLSGNTEKYQAELTNLGGKKLKSGKWSFPIKSKSSVLDTLTKREDYTIEEKVIRDPNAVSTSRLLSYCKEKDIDFSEDREECIKAIYANYTVPDAELRQVIREEIKKYGKGEGVEPESVYSRVRHYFGLHLFNDYDRLLKLLKEEATKLEKEIIEPRKKILTTKPSMYENLAERMEPEEESEKEPEKESEEEPEEKPEKKPEKEPEEEIEVPELPGYIAKREEKEVKLQEKKPRKPRKVKPLELRAYNANLFERIRAGLDRDIVSFTPKNIEFVYAESLKDIVSANTEALLELPIPGKEEIPLPEGEGWKIIGNHPDEDPKLYELRANITLRLKERLSDQGFTPQTLVTLGHLLANKVQYGVRYNSYVESAINYVLQRI
jgi:hypothetical protein